MSIWWHIDNAHEINDEASGGVESNETGDDGNVVCERDERQKQRKKMYKFANKQCEELTNCLFYLKEWCKNNSQELLDNAQVTDLAELLFYH